MKASPQRVAYRYLERRAGLIQPPPAMVDSIATWAFGVGAATEIKRLKEEQALARITDASLQKQRERLRAAIHALQAAPTSWNLYKEFHDAYWTLDHPGTRWSVKDFQKMTPEKKEILDKRVQALTERTLKQLGDREQVMPYADQLGKQIDDLDIFLEPGVGPMGDKLSKKFPIDTTGWRYGGPALEKKLQDTIRSNASEMIELLLESRSKDEANFEATAMFKDMLADAKKKLETGESSWKDISVELHRKGKNYGGFWRELPPTLVIVMPTQLHENGQTALMDTIEHELVHFTQTYLGHVVGKTFGEGLPGRPALPTQTPAFKQQLAPHHPNFDPKSDRVRKTYRALRDQGVDPKKVDFHSLDDVEFYSKLADSIKEFRRTAIRYRVEGEDRTRQAIRHWVGGKVDPAYSFSFRSNRFFVALKQQANAKWKKAVAEFIKAVL